MSACIAVHIADQENAARIRAGRLLPGTSKGLWLGSGSYSALCQGLSHFDECVEYGKRFVVAKKTYSGQYAVVITKVDPEGMIRVQGARVRRALDRFRDNFKEQVTRSNLLLPKNTETERPASFVMFQMWRTLTNQTLSSVGRSASPMRIRSTLCRFVDNPKSDAPIEHPYELCVHDVEAAHPLYVGTAEDAKSCLREELMAIVSLDDFYIDRDLEVAGATYESADLISKMQRIDFATLVDRIANPEGTAFGEAQKSLKAARFDSRGGMEAKRARADDLIRLPFPAGPSKSNRARVLERLESHVRAKNLKSDVLRRDLDRIFSDFERRIRETDQLELAIEDVAARIGDLSPNPVEAAQMLISKFVKGRSENPISTILKQLPVEVRNIRDLEGQAYFFPRGEITERSVLVVRRSGAKQTRQSMFDRAHELGHFVFDECGMSHPDEESWCDQFAGSFVRESLKSK
jgi:hypothetical protein